MRRRQVHDFGQVIPSGFNSRLREEATIECEDKLLYSITVSTHASVRRRLANSTLLVAVGSFNSRLREEATIIWHHIMLVVNSFNSRLREEAT